jgi:hypothetical protein
VTARAFREGTVQWPSSVPRAPVRFIMNESVRFEDALERETKSR